MTLGLHRMPAEPDSGFRTEKTQMATNKIRNERNSKTEEAFLDAAERLFAENGFEGTKVRAIAEASDANLGALHYYWGSKEALFSAVWKRRMLPLIEQRRRFMQEVIDQADSKPVDLETLITMWIEAGLGLTTEGEPNEAFQRLYGRALTDPSPAVQAIVSEYLDETSRTLVSLLKRACPELSDNEIYWRIHGLLGAILYAHIGQARLARIAQDLDADRTLKEGARQLVQYIVAGFRAPPAAAKDWKSYD
jgi:AcrR family transcriptional regulator